MTPEEEKRVAQITERWDDLALSRREDTRIMLDLLAAAAVALDTTRSNNRDLWDALSMIREEVEQHGPVGSGEYAAGPTPAHEAQQLVEAIAAQHASAATLPPTLSSFDEFWSLYGKRGGKAAAVRAWARKIKTVKAFTTVLAAVRMQIAWRASAKELGVFFPEWPHASSWINGERWDDEMPEELKDATSTATRRNPWDGGE